MANTDTQLACFGLSADHIAARTQLPFGVRHPIHRDAIQAFLDLQSAAAVAGFDLQIVSGFRDFERQMKIWRDKAEGRRVVLDDNSQPLDLARLSDAEKALAIMRWSALPGCSRHHWGSDFDVYDAAAVAADYQVQLVPDEVEAGGVFAPLHDWLDAFIQNNPHTFFRPYAEDRGGIAPERWHLSYLPVARRFEAVFDVEALVAIWRLHQLPLLDAIIALPTHKLQRYLPIAGAFERDV